MPQGNALLRAFGRSPAHGAGQIARNGFVRGGDEGRHGLLGGDARQQAPGGGGPRRVIDGLSCLVLYTDSPHL